LEVDFMKGLFTVAVAALGSTLALSACGLGDLTGARQVGVTLDEYHLVLSQPSASAGKLTFKVHNGGREKHEFVILRTQLDPGSLPEQGGKVNEEIPGVEHVDELDGVDTGKDRDLTVDLKPGTYIFVCNIVGHAHQGMVARFTVS
jgi:uncharacterized cupredoxin-like copper-binding protein